MLGGSTRLGDIGRWGEWAPHAETQLWAFLCLVNTWNLRRPCCSEQFTDRKFRPGDEQWPAHRRIAWARQKGSGIQDFWWKPCMIPRRSNSRPSSQQMVWTRPLVSHRPCSWSGVPLLAFLLKNRHSILPPPSWLNSGWDKLGELHLKQQKIYINPNTYLVNSLCWVQKGHSSRVFKFSPRFKITLPTRACLLGI